MRFQVAKQDLEAALQVVTPSLSGTGTGVTTHYAFRRTGTKEGGYGVEVITCSERLFSSCPLKAKVDDPGKKGSFTVEGKRLQKWLSNVANAALDFTFDEEDSEVVAKAPRGKQTFQSLQPDSRFTWAAELKDAESKATIPAERLAKALSYSARFTSAKESEEPELCTSEAKEGILYSTDRKAVSLIRVAGLEESNLRIHGKDAGGFLTFLGSFDNTDVEVLEHDRMLIFQRGDGAVFGATRFQAPFPGINIDMDSDDHHVWTLDKGEISEAIGFLTSGASWEDNRLRLSPGEADGEVVFSMVSATGKTTTLTLNCTEHSSADGAPEVPDDGFVIDHFLLAKVLGVWKADQIPLGITITGNRGFVRFVTEQDDDKYLTILAWLR